MDLKDKSNRPDEANIYDFDEVPERRDLVLIGSDQLDLFRQRWKQFLANPPTLDNPYGGARFPDDVLRTAWCSIDTRGADSHDAKIFITILTRYHRAVRKLPRSKFVVCLDFWNWQKPCLVVEQDWSAEIQRSLFSLYGLVDANCRTWQLLDAFGGAPGARGRVLYQDIADRNRFRTSLTLQRCPGKSSEP